MQRNREAITNQTVLPIRFWSNGNMARSAFNRIEILRSNNRSDEALLMLNEWILD